MIKLLIFIIIGYLCYREIKKWMAKSTAYRQEVRPGATGEIDDIMEKDPTCGIYFPKKDGVHLQYKGEDLYFCSDACKEKYISNN